MFKLALQNDVHPRACASLQMQTEHRCGYCAGNHVFAMKLNKVLPSCPSRHHIYLIDLGEKERETRERGEGRMMGGRGDRQRWTEGEREEGELAWGRQKGETREREIAMPYGSGWKTDGRSLEKSNLLFSGVLRNVSI